MFKFLTFPHIWHPLVLISTLVILSSVRKAFLCREVECEVFRRGQFGDVRLGTIITIFRNNKQLVRVLTSVWSKRQHFNIRQEPPTRSMLSPTWIFYFFLRSKDVFCLPNPNPLRDGCKPNADVMLREINLGLRLICQQICPEISVQCSVPCHNLLRSLNETGLSWFP